MSRHAKTDELIDAAKIILAEENPMTLRQVFYQLVSSWPFAGFECSGRMRWKAS